MSIFAKCNENSKPSANVHKLLYLKESKKAI